MSKKQIYNITYAFVMVIIVGTLIIYQDIQGSLMIILASLAFILTSIFTYSNRRRK